MPDMPILVTRSSMPPLEEYIEEIAPLWDSHWLTNMGIEHQKFESMLKEFLKVKNVCLYTNGHSALEGAFEALELGKDGRSEVITTPFTFASTTHAIFRKGLTPVFADVKPDDYTIDPVHIKRLITENTCAIVPVHVYGNVCDIDAIQDIADACDLKVIYDAAHAFGVKRNNTSVAAFGDISMFSFHATKVFNTIEGGALCFGDASLETVLNQLKNFGITGPDTVEYIGGNSKMNEFCAAMGICNLRHLDEEIEKRRIVFERYLNNLQNIKGIRLCEVPSGIRSNYAYMPVVFEDEFGSTRDEVFEALKNNGIGARKYFYPLASDFECYKDQFDSSQTPYARSIADRILTLPLYADLSLDDVDRICRIVTENSA